MLVQERRLAVEQGYEDPVNPSFEATTDMYYKVASMLLLELKVRPRGQMHVIFASHNDETIMWLLNKYVLVRHRASHSNPS